MDRSCRGPGGGGGGGGGEEKECVTCNHIITAIAVPDPIIRKYEWTPEAIVEDEH